MDAADSALLGRLVERGVSADLIGTLHRVLERRPANVNREYLLRFTAMVARGTLLAVELAFPDVMECAPARRSVLDYIETISAGMTPPADSGDYSIFNDPDGVSVRCSPAVATPPGCPSHFDQKFKLEELRAQFDAAKAKVR